MKITSVAFLLSILFMASLGFSSTISEQSFSSLGFSELMVSGQQQTLCSQPIEFNPTPSTDSSLFEVVSLHVSFAPISKGDAMVSLYANGSAEPIQSWKADDVQNNWVRSVIAKQSIPKKSSFAVCLKNSNAITKTILLSDSTIGWYSMPYFEQPIDFSKTVSTNHAIVGQEITVTVKARNSGSQPANVTISLQDESDVLKILRGSTKFQGIIEAGKSISFDYVAKPYYIQPKYIAVGDESPITLSSAKLQFQNDFGEIVSIESSRPTLYVRAPEFNVLPTLLPETQSLKLGESTRVLLAVQNQGKEDLENIQLFVQVPKGLSVAEPGLGSISLKAGETKTISFEAKAVRAGKQSLDCKAIYVDYDAKYSECGKTTIEVIDRENNTAIIAGAILLIVGALVYGIIYYR